MWQIDKEFGFDYGHRVWSQELNKEFATEEQKPVCRHMHGHRAKVRVFLEGGELTRGMVTDFHHLNWTKKFLNTYLDHKFIVDINDPGLIMVAGGEFDKNEMFVTVTKKNLCLIEVYVPETEHLCGSILDTSGLTGVEKEIYEGLFFVNFIPTSENLSYWLYHCIRVKMNRIGVKTAKVEWNETPNSRARYNGANLL